jgi:hypothetical protein
MGGSRKFRGIVRKKPAKILRSGGHKEERKEKNRRSSLIQLISIDTYIRRMTPFLCFLNWSHYYQLSVVKLRVHSG